MRKMKDSGVSWIGQIPKDWEVESLKRICDINTGNTPNKADGNTNFSFESGIPWIKAENLESLEPIRETSEYLTSDGAKLGRIFAPYSIYVCCIASVGKVGYSDIKTSCNQQINSISFYKNKYLWKYGLYVLKSAKSEHIARANESVQLILNSNQQKYIKVPVPAIREQVMIVTFLDCECSKIDEAISKHKAIIEKLEEYRKAVITKAVTKGLNPNAEMKDSGVSWIGMIPYDANIFRLKFFSYMKGRIGWQGLKATDFIEVGPYCVTGTDFIDGKVNWNTCYHVSEERYAMDSNIQIKKGDLLMTKDGTIGKLAIIEELPGKACLNSHLLIIRPLENKYTNKYLFYVMKSHVFSKYCALVSSGSIMDSISQEKIGNFAIPSYSIKEQKKIVQYLDEQCAKIDNAILKHQKSIDKLEEYRKSLIFNAVTGKIDCNERLS